MESLRQLPPGTEPCKFCTEREGREDYDPMTCPDCDGDGWVYTPEFMEKTQTQTESEEPAESKDKRGDKKSELLADLGWILGVIWR